MKKYRQISFRPRPANEKRLELASNLGLNVSEIINEVLDSGFDDVLKKKSKKLQAALSAVPT